MPERPHRFRLRLTAAFVGVAALSSATLALVTYGATSSYRWRNFQQMTSDEVRLALALTPPKLDRDSFERLLGAYEKRSGTDAIAVGPDGSVYSSSVTLSVEDIPGASLEGTSGQLVQTETARDSGRFLVVSGLGPDGAHYAFFFSLEQLESSLAELRVVLVVTWIGVVIVAAAVGELVARRTLRPVRDASRAAAALASGLLETRLVPAGDDEFGAWAHSFNTMADALEAKIDALDRAAQRERQFTSDVAHDLRTPLTGMAVRASLLLEQIDDLPLEAREGVAALAGDVARLKDLVLELLELARLDAGSEVSPPETFLVATGVETALEALGLDSDVTVSVTIDPELTVRAARAPFRRIVANVVRNAATHGGGRIEVTSRAVREMILIRVRDHGPGVDVDQTERIFHRFFKSDGSRALGGSGLGLSIAREHARALAGDITVGHDPAGGAAFTIWLPSGSTERTPGPAMEAEALEREEADARSGHRTSRPAAASPTEVVSSP